MVLWRVWYRRNGVIHDQKILTDLEVVPWATSFLTEFRQANIVTSGNAGEVKKPKPKWTPPLVGKVKMNTDATINSGDVVALLRGLVMASDVGLWPSEVEVDAQTIVTLMDSSGIPFSDVWMVIQDIKLLLEEFPACSVAFVPRNANMVAHCLAKLGLSLVNDCFWM
ncbi:hypothetical protein Dsin_005903 [Dipteronia sinensis]|uniref:RNase H type-1 domain-containing protein n=1 Tax=Dipteronia sinensis TaxID=43782 RepID=A0AAE0EF49_9ROSI|nr:hypothetical protein Dsin_005903 [Dipteronia sinensis]